MMTYSQSITCLLVYSKLGHNPLASCTWQSNSIYSDTGERIKLLRQSQGMTQQDLAEKAGISVSFLSFLESGKRKGSLDSYHKLALSWT